MLVTRSGNIKCNLGTLSATRNLHCWPHPVCGNGNICTRRLVSVAGECVTKFKPLWPLVLRNYGQCRFYAGGVRGAGRCPHCCRDSDAINIFNEHFKRFRGALHR